MLFSTHFLTTIFPDYKGNSSIKVEHIMTDSRKRLRNALFVPIIGDRFDAHSFLHQAIEHGAIAALWDKTIEIPNDIPDSFPFFFVHDTVSALQVLAKHYRDDINPIVIGITGSNGKTTTKDLLASILKTNYKTHATRGNFNNHIGLPLTILEMARDTEVLVLEMGMNHFNEIDLLTKIAKPSYAIITNIGESHIEFLGSREGIAQAKLEIKNGLQLNGKLIIDGDERLFDQIRNEQNIITCGFQDNNEVVISNTSIDGKTTTFMFENKETYTIPLLGDHHAKNAALAIVVAKQLEISIDDIKKGLESIMHSKMRFEWMYGKNNVSIINDAYNASPTSMKAAIQVVKQIQGFKQKIVVLGDILELGEHASSLHLSVAKKIDHPINMVMTLGKNAEFISNYVKKNKSDMISYHYESKEQIVQALQPYLNEDTLILFKASRGMALEHVIEEII